MRKTPTILVILLIVLSCIVVGQEEGSTSETTDKFECNVVNDVAIITGPGFELGKTSCGGGVKLTMFKCVGSCTFKGKTVSGQVEYDGSIGNRLKILDGSFDGVEGITNAECEEGDTCSIGSSGGTYAGKSFAAVEGLTSAANSISGKCQAGCSLPGGAAFTDGGEGKEFTITLGTADDPTSVIGIKGCDDASNPCKLQMTGLENEPVKFVSSAGNPSHIQITTADGGVLRLDSGELVFSPDKGWYIPATAAQDTIINGVKPNLQGTAKDILLVATNKQAPMHTPKNNEVYVEFYTNGVSAGNTLAEKSMFTIDFNPSGEGYVLGGLKVDKTDSFKLIAYNGGLVYVDGSREIPDINNKGHTAVINDKTAIVFNNGHVYGGLYNEGGNSVKSSMRFLDQNNNPLMIDGEEWKVAFDDVDFDKCAAELGWTGIGQSLTSPDVCGVLTEIVLKKEDILNLKELLPLDVVYYLTGPEGCTKSNQPAANNPSATSFLSFVGKAWGWVTGRLTYKEISKCSSCIKSTKTKSKDSSVFRSATGEEKVICNEIYKSADNCRCAKRYTGGINSVNDCVTQQQYDRVFEEYNTVYGAWNSVSGTCYGAGDPEVTVNGMAILCSELINSVSFKEKEAKRLNDLIENDEGYYSLSSPSSTGGQSQYPMASPRPYEPPTFQGSPEIICDWSTKGDRSGYMCKKPGFFGSYDDYLYVYNENSESWDLYYDPSELFIVKKNEKRYVCKLINDEIAKNCTPK